MKRYLLKLLVLATALTGITAGVYLPGYSKSGPQKVQEKAIIISFNKISATLEPVKTMVPAGSNYIIFDTSILIENGKKLQIEDTISTGSSIRSCDSAENPDKLFFQIDADDNSGINHPAGSQLVVHATFTDDQFSQAEAGFTHTGSPDRVKTGKRQFYHGVSISQWIYLF